MVTIDNQVFAFLQKLENHNDREWFATHKDEYQQARHNVEVFVDALIAKIISFDDSIVGNSGKNCIFRIYRDVRFSLDKSPYKRHFGAYIAPGGKNVNRAGYYIHIQDNNSLLAAGLWCPENKILKKIRQELYYAPEDLLSILQQQSFKKEWQTLSEEGMLKRSPRDYPADFQYIDLLKYRSFCVEKSLSNKQVCTSDFLQVCEQAFLSAKDLVKYMNYLIKLED